jgi:hypothetical protein
MTRPWAMRCILAALLAAVATTGWSLAVTRDGPPRDLLRMHDDFVLAFVDSAGFGRTRITPMMRAMQRYRAPGERNLGVVDVALIGIAKHDPPQVFDAPFMGFQHVESGVPQMPRLRGRPLRTDEEDALRALSGGERLVVRAEEDGLRVIGPIRAAGECLGCHEKQRAGDMLGALVYTLRPLPPEKRR